MVPSENRILFRHIAGPVRGMEVEWVLQPDANGVTATITHDLAPRGLLGRMYSNFVGPVFIEKIAGQTLAKIKELVEAGETK